MAKTMFRIMTEAGIECLPAEGIVNRLRVDHRKRWMTDGSSVYLIDPLKPSQVRALITLVSMRNVLLVFDTREEAENGLSFEGERARITRVGGVPEWLEEMPLGGEGARR